MKDKITYLLGNEVVLNEIKNQAPLPIFAKETLEFLQEIAKKIRNKKEKTGDLMAFGFWCRRLDVPKHDERIGRGVSLHFAASNMPMLFAYSMASALLAGNCIVMRLSYKKTEQESMLLEIMEEVMEENPFWKDRIVLLRYEHDSKITDFLSGLCNVRIIWGKDETVEEIKRSPLWKNAVDVTFPDRGSAAVIQAEYIINKKDIFSDLLGFYNDTYAYDQNACSSPTVIYWLGKEEQVLKAKERFWKELKVLLDEKYTLLDVLAVKKWENALVMAAEMPGVKIVRQENLIHRLEVSTLCEECWNYRTPGGFFIEGSGKTLDGLLPVLTEKCQTVTMVGISKEELEKLHVLRVVENGHALDFSLNWEGVDLIQVMSI